MPVPARSYRASRSPPSTESQSSTDASKMVACCSQNPAGTRITSCAA